MKKIITFGTFDLFHIGHLKILQRAKSLGDHLTVGISTDSLNYKKKQKNPIYSQEDRKEIIESLGIVDDVFFEESLELKGDYIKQFNADILVMGDDWVGRFDEFKSLCDVHYLPRTPSVSTTEIIEIIRR